MKTVFACLLFALNLFALSARATGIYTYDVNWPAEHLQGTFTLDVGTGFGDYLSTQASGTYQGVNLFPPQIWTSVDFSVQPDFAQITFIWNQGYTGYACSPSYVGRQTPWTNAEEAWQDLLAKAPSDGIFITVVPEPGVAPLLCVGLISFIVYRFRRPAGRPSS